MPGLALVRRRLGGAAERLHVVRQVPQLTIVEQEVIRRHRRAVEPGQDRADDVAGGWPTLERPASQVRRLDLEVLGRRPVAPALAPVTFLAFRLRIYSATAGEGVVRAPRLRGNGDRHGRRARRELRGQPLDVHDDGAHFRVAQVVLRDHSRARQPPDDAPCEIVVGRQLTRAGRADLVAAGGEVPRRRREVVCRVAAAVAVDAVADGAVVGVDPPPERGIRGLRGQAERRRRQPTDRGDQRRPRPTPHRCGTSRGR